jgi:hypothetical protein
MSDTAHETSDAAHETHEHIHMPPNSWIPISFSCSMAFTFVGFLIHPVVWILGLIWFVGNLWAWFTAARTEYRELPD